MGVGYQRHKDVEKENKKEKTLNRYLGSYICPFSNGRHHIPCAYFGESLDKKYVFDKKYFTIVFVLISVFVSLYLVNKTIKKP